MGMLAAGPSQDETTCLAPSAASAPPRNGSTALIASTCLALSAVTMFGNGTTTYLTFDGSTPSAFSTAFRVRVWMLLVRLTATVLPARSAGLVMPGDRSAPPPEGLGLQVPPSARIFNWAVPLAWASMKET